MAQKLVRSHSLYSKIHYHKVLKQLLEPVVRVCRQELTKRIHAKYAIIHVDTNSFPSRKEHLVKPNPLSEHLLNHRIKTVKYTI